MVFFFIIGSADTMNQPPSLMNALTKRQARANVPQDECMCQTAKSTAGMNVLSRIFHFLSASALSFSFSCVCWCSCMHTLTLDADLDTCVSLVCVCLSHVSMCVCGGGGDAAGCKMKATEGGWGCVFCTAQTSLGLLDPPRRLTPNSYRDPAMSYCSKGARTAAKNTVLANWTQ